MLRGSFFRRAKTHCIHEMTPVWPANMMQTRKIPLNGPIQVIIPACLAEITEIERSSFVPIITIVFFMYV